MDVRSGSLGINSESGETIIAHTLQKGVALSVVAALGGHMAHPQPVPCSVTQKKRCTEVPLFVSLPETPHGEGGGRGPGGGVILTAVVVKSLSAPFAAAVRFPDFSVVKRAQS